MFNNVTFVGLSEFDNNVIYKIAMSVLCGLEYGQCRVVYDPSDIYHITKVSEVIAIVQFYCQCPHDIIIAHFMALRITAFHLTAKARELSRRLICNLNWL